MENVAAKYIHNGRNQQRTKISRDKLLEEEVASSLILSVNISII